LPPSGASEPQCAPGPKSRPPVFKKFQQQDTREGIHIMDIKYQDDTGSGYEISPYVAQLLEWSDERAAAEAFIADVFTQRIESHHPDAMDIGHFESPPTFIERGPAIIGVIVMRDGGKDFSVSKVQQITDDLVRLDSDQFLKRYGLKKLGEMLGWSPERDPYAELASYLNPDDPADGERQIDIEILKYERARAAPRNHWRAGRWLKLLAVILGAIGIDVYLALWMASDVPAALGPLGTYLALVGRVLTLPASIVLAVGGFLSLWFDTCEWGTFTPPHLPVRMAAWLKAEGFKKGLSYWSEFRWPSRKRNANCREVLGFVLWRKTPCPPEKYPRIVYRPNPHREYLDSPEGQEAEALYEARALARMREWGDAVFKINIGVLLAVGCAFAVMPFAGVMYPPVVRIAGVIAIMTMTVKIGYFGPLFCRCPRFLRKWWFRDFPPQAQEYCSHLVDSYG
jgi:hypothetical protein